MIVFHDQGCTGRPPTIGCPACIAASKPRPRNARPARTRHVQDQFALGVHPATGARVRRDVVCGTCQHCTPGPRHRCALTSGRRVRLGWPGCSEHVVEISASPQVNAT